MEPEVDGKLIGRWMSLDGLADLWGVDRRLVIELALIRNWKRERDSNDQTRLLVPLSLLSQRSITSPAAKGRLSKALSLLVDMITDLREPLANLKIAVAELEAEVEVERTVGDVGQIDRPIAGTERNAAIHRGANQRSTGRFPPMRARKMRWPAQFLGHRSR